MLIAASVACRSKEPPIRDRAGSEVAGSGSTAVRSGSDEDTAEKIDRAGHNMTGLRPHQGANCPSSLPGTTTRIEMTPRGVDVTVTAKDAAVVRAIVALAERHARGRTADVAKPHDQRHGASGKVGYCPVVVTELTAVTMTPVRDGATIHVDARAPERVAEVQELVKQRAVRLPGFVSS